MLMTYVKRVRLLWPLLIWQLGCPSSAGPGTELRRESEHFRFESTSEHASEAEMTDGIALAENLFAKISAVVGPARAPSDQIRVVLEGDQTTRGSYLDVDGLHLYRYPAQEGGYWATFAHEMVHAFGAAWFIAHSAWNWPTYRFFDEGFAEYIAQEVDPAKYGFPFFGFSEDAIVGHWVVSELSIPFPTLRRQHDSLNTWCSLQAYTLRASWFRHVESLLGRDALLRLVYPDDEPTTQVVEALLGISLEELDARWEPWITARYLADPDTAAAIQGFAARTPWYQACTPGVDF